MTAATRTIVKATSALALLLSLAAPATARSDVRPAGVCHVRTGGRTALRGLGARIHARVASRMRRVDATVQERVARIIVSEAKLAGVDPLLVLALIHVESSFDPHAVSSAGAVGLMQLRESTMRGEVERWRLPSADPHDPVASVQAGVRYLKRLIDAFGEVDMALMAYNAGPNRILGHLRNGGIPERFHSYPRKVREEMERLRRELEVAV